MHEKLAVAAAAFVLLAAQPAAAEDILTPSTNPTWAALNLGPSIAVLACGGGGCGSGSVTQFKLSQEIGYHVSGDGEGFALGLHISEAFGNSVFRFQPGFRMWGDIGVSEDLAIYITPHLHLGYGLLTGGGATAHAFNPNTGLAARAVLGDVGMIVFQPVGFDFLINDNGMIMAYELMFGGGVTF